MAPSRYTPDKPQASWYGSFHIALRCDGTALPSGGQSGLPSPAFYVPRRGGGKGCLASTMVDHRAWEACFPGVHAITKVNPWWLHTGSRATRLQKYKAQRGMLPILNPQGFIPRGRIEFGLLPTLLFARPCSSKLQLYRPTLPPTDGNKP